MRQLQRREGGSPSILDGIIRRLRELTGVADEEGGLRATLEELIQDRSGAGEGERLSESERRLLLNALAFGELEVADVMVPRADIKAVEAGTDLRGVIDAIVQARHSRLPVYRQNLDDVIGVVHVKDLLPFWGDGAAFDLASVVRKILVVPPSMRVVDLLREMRDSGVHMAVVVDEFGGTDGLVTIEDIVQEIVGEIQDEDRGEEPADLVRREDGSLDVDGRIELEELEAALGVRLLDEESEDDADTLGGLLFMMLDRVPTRGERVRHPAGFEFEVIDADPRRIKRVRVRDLREAARGGEPG
jgi:CBS domain containing-hemolysin-like protein